MWILPWGAKSQIGTNFEICMSKFANFTNFESSYKFMYGKIEINNYTDMTKFENDWDIRYQIFTDTIYFCNTKSNQMSDIYFMYNSKFLSDKQISDIYSMRCLVLVSRKPYDFREIKWVSRNQNRFPEIEMSFWKSNQSPKTKWSSRSWGEGGRKQTHINGHLSTETEGENTHRAHLSIEGESGNTDASLNWGWG